MAPLALEATEAGVETEVGLDVRCLGEGFAAAIDGACVLGVVQARLRVDVRA